MKQTVLSRRELIAHSVTAGLGAAALGVGADALGLGARPPRKVIVWSEGTAPKNVYPADVNSAIAEGLEGLKGWEIVTASLNDPDQGLSVSALQSASVLIWWGHARHGDVSDGLVDRIVKRVREEGMGFIPTHSAHWSKPFKKLMGTECGWTGGYVEDGSKLLVKAAAPKHPIARGLGNFVVPHTERYTEKFQVPEPEALVFDGTYTLPNGKTEEARQGLTWQVGKGRVFYFQPGHESYPIYFQPEIRQVFHNAVLWAADKR